MFHFINVFYNHPILIQASVSMWTQTADTKIENKGAFVIDINCVLRVNEGELLRASESLETKVTSYSIIWRNEKEKICLMVSFIISGQPRQSHKH